MKYPEDKNILNFIISNNDICEIIRDDLDTIEGTPIKYNKEFMVKKIWAKITESTRCELLLS